MAAMRKAAMRKAAAVAVEEAAVRKAAAVEEKIQIKRRARGEKYPTRKEKLDFGSKIVIIS